ncbi:MAG: WG repeat-containing protein [Prevotella sp.]|nr:WG repeat-containing protein [Prevotella sp.]
MVEHYSHKIQNAIQKELFKANSSIKIAVAWFTNDLLFQPLLLKLASGVSVELILNKDEINCSDDNEIDFDEFVKAGGVLRWNDTKQLMHDKFCIIDNKIVISGSYNWTNKAEHNEENITIFKDETETIYFYCKKYERLSTKYNTVQNFIIKNIESKNSIEIVNKQISKKEVFDNSMINNACHPQKIIGASLINVETLRPLHYEPYVTFNFYDDITIVQTSSTTNIIIARLFNKYLILDACTFLPINNFSFSDYVIVGDVPCHYFPSEPLIWLCCSEKWGLYNIKLKKFCIPAIFDSFKSWGQIFNQFEVVIGDKHGVADTKGEWLVKCMFDDVCILGNHHYQVRLNNKYAIINHGNLMVEFDSRTPHGVVSNHGKYGLIGYEGKVILGFEYDEIEYWEPFGCGCFILKKDGMYGICAGGKTTPCIYHEKYFNMPCIDSFHGDKLILKKDTPLI